jgi:hypothetical protein
VSDRESLDLPIGRWILWGLGAIVALGLILWFIFGRDNTESEEPPLADAEQIEWSIVLTDMTGATVILKADLPLGTPTETWQGEVMIARDISGGLEWDLEEELPVAVVEINGTDECDALNEHLAHWVSEIGAAEGEALNVQARAFAQHTVDHMRSLDCDIDESALDGV